MRSHFRGTIVLTALLCGCGGGGTSVSLPAASPVVATGTLPVSTSGIVVATGPLTMVTGGSMIGSTVLPGSATAIFTINSGTAPQQIPVGGTLATFAITVDDNAGLSTATVARATAARAAGVARTALVRDRDIRMPDRADGTRLRAALFGIAHRPTRTDRTAASANRVARGFAPGDQKTFAIQAGTITGSNVAATALMRPATLVAQSGHANVWLDNAIATDPAEMQREFPSGGSDFAAVTRAFETAFGVETQAFGPAYTTGIVNFAECDADGAPLAVEPVRPDTTGAGDPHINIVITNALSSTGEGGYFYGLDLLGQAEANCVAGKPKPAVNGLAMLVIASDSYVPYNGGATQTYPANNEAYWLHGDMPQTIAHEFQHYLHFVNKYLQQHVDHPANPDAGTLDDSFIDEGCSVLAQDLVAGDAVGSRESPVFVRAFLLEPADFSLTAFTGFQPNVLDVTGASPAYAYYRNTAGNYGYAYLFVRYLYDRFGPGALKAIYAETDYGNARNPDTGPATAAAGGESFAQLFREFTTAIAVHSGGSVAELSTDPAYHFDSSVILRGTVKTYSRRLPPYDVRTIVQPGPLDPETFVNNIPTGTVSLTGGESASVNLIDGGAVFINARRPWAKGATLFATGPIAGGGSLGQGALPTPAPADF